MIFTIAGVLITLVILIWYCIKEELGLGLCALSVVGSIVLGIFLFMTSALVSSYTPREMVGEPIRVEEITALSDSSTVYISRYTVSGSLEYRYLTETDCGLSFRSVYARESYIKFTEDTPRVEVYETRASNGFIDFLFGWTEYRYIFYVPEGSVIDGYEIDLK